MVSSSSAGRRLLPPPPGSPALQRTARPLETTKTMTDMVRHKSLSMNAIQQTRFWGKVRVLHPVTPRNRKEESL